LLSDNEVKEGIRLTALRLLATLFYFVPKSCYKTAESCHRIDGEIRCRLNPAEPIELSAMLQLRKKIKCFAERVGDACHTLGEGDWGVAIRKEGFAFKCQIDTNDIGKEYTLVAAIFVAEGVIQTMPISGFPCKFSGKSILF